jgi:uncharacterized lipoprotein YehR (DUF1307 family)
MMNTILLILVLQVIVVSLTGCTTFEDKMQLQCQAPVDSSMCSGWQT